MANWTFLSNHGQALLCIAHDPDVRLREIAASLGITERSAYAIVSDLADAGYILKEKDGRRNRYHLQHHLPLPETPVTTVSKPSGMSTSMSLRLCWVAPRIPSFLSPAGRRWAGTAIASSWLR